MDIQFLGHASFRIKGKAAVVVTDPFDPAFVGMKYPKVSADIVTVSHSHSDHNYIQNVTDVKRVISGPGEYEIQGVTVIGLSVYHDEKKGELRGKNTIYIYEMDNLRLCHLGDLGHKLSDKILEDIGNIDILMIPVGGEYTIGPSEAVEVINQIEPSIIIPMHYQVPELKTELFEKLKPVESFLNNAGIPYERMDKLNIKYGDINEAEQKIIVLERK